MSAADVGSVILASVETKPSVKDFDAIIVGSCIHMGSWVKKGSKFIKENATALRDNPKPTWAFSAGKPPENKFLAEERDITGCVSKKIPVQEHKLFWGCVSKQQMVGCFNFFFTCFGLKYEDQRDWEAMDEWADGISKLLRNEQQCLVTLV
ncbi:uncharacterized protein RCO7_00941 [Rhynchosporium graminicola]|uniref:Flavodoxin domain-containing protein n=1 Tax=Rhynchosporium graminicola TaxID=2792576 RepID=A0A1E1JQD1_9HELO|nr:uncharacterized protein RCO7_00941 [Rhynchosporium commune]